MKIESWLVVGILGLTLGCEKKTEAPPEEPQETVPTKAEPEVKAEVKSEEPQGWTEQTMMPDGMQRFVAVANEAQRQLGTQLVKKLGESIAEGGPAAGIDVCSKEAPQIAKAVGEANKVRIGRTSHKLRNPNNNGPEWMSKVVEEKSESRRYFMGPDGTLGVATPIPLAEMCSQCHGPAENISQEVKDALAKTYPQDLATGFEVGEVRGWFWVEVPKESLGSTTPPAE